MTSKLEQHSDELAKKVFKSIDLEKPSVNFTDNIISQLEAKPSIVYKPLISKKGWFVIIAGLIILSLVMMFGGFENNQFIEAIDYSVISNNKLSELFSGIEISKTVLYSIVLFGMFWFIQIPLIKFYYKKQVQA